MKTVEVAAQGHALTDAQPRWIAPLQNSWLIVVIIMIRIVDVDAEIKKSLLNNVDCYFIAETYKNNM